MKQEIENEQFLAKLARYVFIIYLFFVFFGTDLPFQPPITEIDEKGGSNIVNQVVFSSLFLASLLPFWFRRDEAVRILKKEKWLTLFLCWCIISVIWSGFPFVTFKRGFQIIITFIICLNALLWVRSSYELLDCFKKILNIYIVMSILSVIFIPGAIDPTTLTWRALASSKNHLGQAALVSVIIYFISMSYNESKRHRLDGLMLVLSLILLAGSESMTSIITLFCLGLLLLLMHLNKRFKRLGLKQFFMIYTVAAVLALGLIIVQFPVITESLLHIMDKEITFTGRTDLWARVFQETKQHLVLGAGFGGFWVVDNPAVINIYKEFVWLPNQAHIGYLDILNETGIIGFLLFSLMTLTYFRNLARFPVMHPWAWCFLAALIINFQESTLFRQNVLTGVIFIFSYLCLYHDLYIEESQIEAIDMEKISSIDINEPYKTI